MEESAHELSILWHIYVPIGIWLIAVIILIILLLIKYPFGNWTQDNPNPYSGESLSIPRGVFRAILTLSLLFVAILFEVYNLSEGNSEDNIFEFLTAFKMMIAFYFGAKVAHHVSSTNRAKAKYEAEAIQVAKTVKPEEAEETGYSEFEEDEEAAG